VDQHLSQPIKTSTLALLGKLRLQVLLLLDLAIHPAVKELSAVRDTFPQILSTLTFAPLLVTTVKIHPPSEKFVILECTLALQPHQAVALIVLMVMHVLVQISMLVL
jgi:hypothetical protein